MKRTTRTQYFWQAHPEQQDDFTALVMADPATAFQYFATQPLPQYTTDRSSRTIPLSKRYGGASLAAALQPDQRRERDDRRPVSPDDHVEALTLNHAPGEPTFVIGPVAIKLP